MKGKVNSALNLDYKGIYIWILQNIFDTLQIHPIIMSGIGLWGNVTTKVRLPNYMQEKDV